MLKRNWIITVLLVAAAFVGLAAPAAIANEQSPAAPSGWEFSMSPYAWVLFITGDVTVGTNTNDVNTNVFEIIKETDEFYGFMSYQELRRGKLGVFADVVWGTMNMGTGAVIDENPIPGLDPNIVADANIGFDLLILEPGVAYEIKERSSGGSLKDPVTAVRTTAIDVLAGARYWYMRPDIDLTVTGAVNIPALGLVIPVAGRVAAKTTFDWWDPYIGLRVRQKRGLGKELVLRGDIGGFGVGSDLTWQASGSYSFHKRFLGRDMVGFIGYRAIYTDYKQGSGANTFAVDWLWHGPTMGLKFTW